jgi:hypothetical protein
MEKIKFDKIAAFGTELWKKEMAQLGGAMLSAKLSRIFFVHGTFAGTDPLGLLGVIGKLTRPSFLFAKLPLFAKKLQLLSKNIIDNVVDDLGNFPAKDIKTYAAALGIDCTPFNWTSENNHIGRLLEVPNLAADIVEKTSASDERVLLIGHSHAGQIFALLTTFLENGNTAEALYAVLTHVEEFDKHNFSKNLATLSNIHLDFVTLGTPVRYPWGNYQKYQLLNIINHRSDSWRDGIWNTRDGDYVQQWATEKTDLPTSKAWLKIANDKLDFVLDKGPIKTLNIKLKLQEIKRRQPIKINGKQAGDTVLVDYLDNKTVITVLGFKLPNLIKTLFGHGVYTRRNSTLFNLRLIVEKFYS